MFIIPNQTTAIETKILYMIYVGLAKHLLFCCFFSNVYHILMIIIYFYFQLDELDSQAAEINKTSEISNLIKDVSLICFFCSETIFHVYAKIKTQISWYAVTES